MEVNLNNPIFAYYFNCENMSRQSVDQALNQLNANFDRYTNITFWIVPANYTKIECVYNGQGSKYLISKIEDLLTKLSIDYPNNEIAFSNFKQELRELLISEIVN